MAQSLSKLLVHVIFSTKERKRWLDENLRTELHPYMATVLNNLDCHALEVGGTDDHVHILCVLSKNLSAAQLVKEVKPPCSKWVKSQGGVYQAFGWQNGYGAFSVSASLVNEVRKYIQNQEERHRKDDFKSEFRAFLKRYDVSYDESYVWD